LEAVNLALAAAPFALPEEDMAAFAAAWEPGLRYAMGSALALPPILPAFIGPTGPLPPWLRTELAHGFAFRCGITSLRHLPHLGDGWGCEGVGGLAALMKRAFLFGASLEESSACAVYPAGDAEVCAKGMWRCPCAAGHDPHTCLCGCDACATTSCAHPGSACTGGLCTCGCEGCKPAPPGKCKVDECTASAAACQRRRAKVCVVHSNADSVSVDGVLSRFCPMCANVGPLAAFTGAQRRCTACNAAHNAGQRERRAAKKLAAAG
jgi:hypothetical protein